jgi:hypothetical protein
MSEPERIGQSSFIAICSRLSAAQRSATTPEERDAADHEMAHFLKMNGAGRLQEWIDSRREQA